jgi:hypothetical protein
LTIKLRVVELVLEYLHTSLIRVSTPLAQNSATESQVDSLLLTMVTAQMIATVMALT